MTPRNSSLSSDDPRERAFDALDHANEERKERALEKRRANETLTDERLILARVAETAQTHSGVVALIAEMFDAESTARSCRMLGDHGRPIRGFDGDRYYIARRVLEALVLARSAK